VPGRLVGDDDPCPVDIGEVVCDRSVVGDVAGSVVGDVAGSVVAELVSEVGELNHKFDSN
jgi:hypothetical protein